MIPAHKAFSKAVGIWLLNEGKGTVAADFSGNHNDGSLKGAAKWNPNGKYGACVEGNGTDGWVEIPNSPILTRGQGPFTVMAWVKTKVAGWYGVFSKGDNVANHQDWGLYTNNGKIDFRGNWPEAWTGEKFIGKNAAQVGEWAHFAVSWDQKRLYFYFNGESDSDFEWAGPFKDTNAILAIGADPAGGSESINGFVDEVAMFDESLSKQKIKKAMEGLEKFSAAVSLSGKLTITWASIKTQ